MKVNFNEWLSGAEIFLEPETIKELNDLARFAFNAKKEPAHIYLRFSDDGKPYLDILFNKRIGPMQTNTIRPYKK